MPPLVQYEDLTNYHFKWDKILLLDISVWVLVCVLDVLCRHLDFLSYAESSLYVWHFNIMHSKATAVAKIMAIKL